MAGATPRLLPKARLGNVYLIFLTAVASIGGFLFGYDTGVISGAMLLIRDAFDLSDSQHEAVVSSTIGAAAVGSLGSGYLNRVFGRRPTLLLGWSRIKTQSHIESHNQDRIRLK